MRQVYIVHLFPALAHARHYTGSADNLRARLTDHALGRGARILQVQRQRGGTWVLGRVLPGSRVAERDIKNGKNVPRLCNVCHAEKDLAAGKITPEQALVKAGYDNATEYDRSLLLEIFGVEKDKAPEPDPAPSVELSAAPEAVKPSPEVDALVDGLIAGWTKPASVKEMEMEMS